MFATLTPKMTSDCLTIQDEPVLRNQILFETHIGLRLIAKIDIRAHTDRQTMKMLASFERADFSV